MPALAIARSESPGAGSNPALLRFLRLHNPFYLLSALCMLAGCWLLAGSLTGAGHGARLWRVFTLAGLLNFYEFILVGLAVFLVRRRGLEREGRMLLIIETVFLADATNLYAESWTIGLGTGLAVNAAALALGAAKVALAVRGLGLRPSARALAGLAAAGTVLLAMPGALAAINRGGASMELPIHGAWWLLSATLLAVFLLLRGQLAGRGAIERALGRALAGMLLGSLLVHTAAASWVHAAGFHLSHLAPLLAALAVISWRTDFGRVLDGAELALLRAGLATAAIGLGAFFPESLTCDLPGFVGVTFSPLRGVLLALSPALLWALPGWRRWKRISAAAAMFLPSTAGHSLSTITRTWFELGASIVPRTAGQWGGVALAAAFLLLAAGALLSLGPGGGGSRCAHDGPAPPAEPQTRAVKPGERGRTDTDEHRPVRRSPNGKGMYRFEEADGGSVLQGDAP